MAKLLLLNGPNLNLLGTREPEIYGHTTLADVEKAMTSEATAAGHSITCLQSNREYEIVEAIHEARTAGVAYCIINPAAFTHTSVAIRDAFAGTALPFIAVHITNVHARESFRHHSYLSDVASGTIVGLGVVGYTLAMTAICESLADRA